MLYRKSKHTFFRKSRRFLDNVEKYGGAREAADNMADARCMLDKATCAQAHAHARASTRTHSPTHILPYISFFFLLTNYCSRTFTRLLLVTQSFRMRSEPSAQIQLSPSSLIVLVVLL